MEKVRRTAALYYLLQGISVIAWWATLIAAPASRGWFQLEADSQISLLAFWLPDAVFIAPGSLVAAYLIYSRNRFETAAMWLLTGAVSYATLYTLAFAMMTDRGWLGVVLMLPAMLWTGVFATALTVKNEMFRQARISSTNYVMLKTFVQIVVVWSIILIVFPYLITIVEDKLGVPSLQFACQRPIAAILFAALSSIGVYAAIVMSRLGKGTPLPLDHASDLVIQGPTPASATQWPSPASARASLLLCFWARRSSPFTPSWARRSGSSFSGRLRRMIWWNVLEAHMRFIKMQSGAGCRDRGRLVRS